MSAGGRFDLVVVGGGLVGASLVCALAGQGLRMALVEAQPLKVADLPGYDDRGIALAAGSQRIFAGMGLWPALAGAATPIRRIHVSDRGRFGFVRLDAADEGVPALGYVALARELGAALLGRLGGLAEVTLFSPARVADFAADGAGARLTLATEGGARQTLEARLVVAADGTRSALRDRLGIATTERDYGQSAVIANVSPQLAHEGVAYERFTDTGPLALLPMSEGRCALVWTVPADRVEAVMALDDAGFLAGLQARFGQRLGRLERVGRRSYYRLSAGGRAQFEAATARIYFDRGSDRDGRWSAYPLRLVRAKDALGPRLALIGNAAHTLHPIAGQGFNLGLRDVAALAEVLVEARRAGEDPGAPEVLARYARWRRADQRRVVAFTDGLNRLFASPLPPLACARDLGMLALDLLPPAKRGFGRLAMGRAGRLPRLARGLPLGEVCA